MRLWFNTLLRLLTGAYFALTSVYCLLAFLPYTYCGFIKAPPYPWMPWFVHHQAALYWAAIVAALLANWRIQDFLAKDARLLTGLAALVFGGIYLSFRPFLPGLTDDRAAYWWSLAALIPLAGLGLWGCSKRNQPRGSSVNAENSTQHFSYPVALLIAFVITLVYFASARFRIHSETGSFSLNRTDVEITFWSLLSHCAVAIMIFSALNLVSLIAAKTQKPQTFRRGMTGTLIVVALWMVLARFFNNALSFDGWAPHVYAISLALALTLWGFSLVLPILQNRASLREASGAGRLSLWQSLATWTAAALFIALALASRRLIGGEDWNGFVEATTALILWIGLSVCFYRLRPARANYSLGMVLAILAGSAIVYKSLQFTEIFWGHAIGSTDDEISLKLEDYGERDASFQLAHHILGNGRDQACGDLCRILREYTNVRRNQIFNEVRLVDNMTATQDDRPNIFMFVIDSMRPDYLGAYNPRVDYTPNIDALARDSIVFTNVYSQYAGTSLSEPAIWAGATLLHTHYPEPFDKVNSLARLTRTDHYQLVASMDEMLNQVLPPANDVTLLDTDKKLWNQLEICSTVQQAKTFLDGYNGGPVFLYTQPKNVHQFARNDVPSPTSQHWPDRPGLNSRITYEVHWVDSCLGEFFNYLKRRGMYDNSIIIVTSDHGDATGEFGRLSHSTSLWPEIMHVPLIVHLPSKMRAQVVYEPARLSTLADVMPSLYYLLGHRPIRENPLYGRPLFAETTKELESYPRGDVLLASDVRAVYGILTADSRYFYATYDSPAQSYLFDLSQDPNAQHNILTPTLKRQYDEEIIQQLHQIGDYYGYKPGVESLLASSTR